MLLASHTLPALPELLTIPPAFKAAHMVPQELLELLGFQRFGETAESEFWTAYKRGLIPPGVLLPSNRSLLVWSRAFIAQWVQAGCPPMPNVLQHEADVYGALVAAVEDALPVRPTTPAEIN